MTDYGRARGELALASSKLSSTRGYVKELVFEDTLDGPRYVRVTQRPMGGKPDPTTGRTDQWEVDVEFKDRTKGRVVYRSYTVPFGRVDALYLQNQWDRFLADRDDTKP